MPGRRGEPGYRAVLRAPGVRWMLAVTVLLMLACYAQFDSGLPAYVLSVLHVAPRRWAPPWPSTRCSSRC